MAYVLEGYWACGYTDACPPVVPGGGAGGKEPKQHKPKKPHGRRAAGDFAIALPGVDAFFAAADAAEPAPVVFVESAPPPLYPEQPPVDLEPTRVAIARANAAIAQAFAIEQARTAQAQQQARAQQQKIAKVLAVVNFVESLNGA